MTSRWVFYAILLMMLGVIWVLVDPDALTHGIWLGVAGLITLLIVLWKAQTDPHVGEIHPDLQRQRALQTQQQNMQAQIVCPHCQQKGHVTTKLFKMKKGISGGKATAAILTVGVSLLATGLSRKEDVTVAKCSNCGSQWEF